MDLKPDFLIKATFHYVGCLEPIIRAGSRQTRYTAGGFLPGYFEGVPGFSILTAHTLNSGILATGSSTGLVS